MDGLSKDDSAVVALVHEFTDNEVKPAVLELEHANAYPEKLIDQMKEMGIFGLAISEPWGEEAARQLVLYAVRRYDSSGRADMEAGMAKLFVSETAMEIALNAVRVHGGYGYSTEFDAERYFRDAPLMIVGEGTNEIQRSVIARQLNNRHPAR